MKKVLLSISILAATYSFSSAQVWTNATLDINEAEAMINSNGDLFWDYSAAQFEIPKGSGKNTILAGALWVGGLDTSGQLYLGAQTYRQSGNDFYPGPVMNSASYSPANDALWNKVWKINRTTIDSFRLGLFSIIPNEIATWPGNGNVSMGQAAQLAAYVDVDADNVYNPTVGDYPCIKGDQALFVIFNDDRNVHTETGGQKMRFEFHAMLYAYKSPGTWLDTIVFLNYKMFNRSGITLTDGYIGSWMDLELGHPGDDFVGCDVGRNTFYVYNGDVDDGSSPVPVAGTYGANPPAQGVVFLRGPFATPNDGVDNNRNGTVDESGEICLMNKFVYYNNTFTTTGNPVTAWDYYKYMSGRWLDSTFFTYGGNGYGGSLTADFMFPDNSDPIGWGTNFIPQPSWSESTAGNTPSDRRGFAASGPFTISPGGTMCLDFAFVYGRGNSGPGSSVNVMRTNADSARVFYNSNSPCTCVINPLSINENAGEILVQFYPNPSSDDITVSYLPKNADARLDVYDMTGKIVVSEKITRSLTLVDMKKLSGGIYLIRITDGANVGTAKVLKD